MTGQVLRPPGYDYGKLEGPLLFLAGPIQGAPDWQTLAIRHVQTTAPSLHVASPRREYPPGSFEYGAQVDWETVHLGIAARTGAIMFWLAAEREHVPGRAYAQTSRWELAEWKARYEYGDVRLVVGIEKGFSGERYIRRRLAQDCPDVPVCEYLLEACNLAITEARRPR